MTGGRCWRHDPRLRKAAGALGGLEKIAEEIEPGSAELHGAGDQHRGHREKVMERLRNVDQVAYVRFASVYRQFKDIDTFMTS